MLSSLIVPRPIAMISTVDEDGTVNVAPYSYFMPVTGQPPLLAVTMGGRRESDPTPKDTWRNASRTGEFVVNVTTDAMRAHIETAAMEFPAGVSEIDALGWHTLPSVKVSHPSIAESPAHLECRVHQVVDLGTDDLAYSTVHVVFAEVVCITMDESICTPDLRIDPQALAPVGRMTFPWFVRARGDALFPLERVPYSQYERSSSAMGIDEVPAADAVDGWVARDNRPIDPAVMASASRSQSTLGPELRRLRAIEPDAAPFGSFDFGTVAPARQEDVR
jgi:flavin reductase (DIM6/NTAB) family NADH-FMN oxidoreductase RutF